MRNNNTSFRISEIPREKKYIVCYKRSFNSSWNHYQEHGKFVQHDSWAAAFEWLVERNGKNVAYVLLHFCGTLPAQDVHTRYGTVTESNFIVEIKMEEQAPQDDVTPFEYLCEAYGWVKDELTPDQAFYFLRGCLYQWCIEHGQSIQDMEELFIADCRYIATQGK